MQNAKCQIMSYYSMADSKIRIWNFIVSKIQTMEKSSISTMNDRQNNEQDNFWKCKMSTFLAIIQRQIINYEFGTLLFQNLQINNLIREEFGTLFNRGKKTNIHLINW